MTNFKICLLGAFSVGKSSLMRRFVHEVFDDRYTTTLGVKIETREVYLDSGTVKLVIWDMEGAEYADPEAELVNSRMQAYLRGVNAVLLVADGTRPATQRIAARLSDWLHAQLPGTPAVLLLNKSDLKDKWQPCTWEPGSSLGSLDCLATSALTGENVEEAFNRLAQFLTESL